MRDVLRKQGSLEELIVVTSTSAWTPRSRESIYNFVKAGERLFTKAMVVDDINRVGRALDVGPGGMNTDFWAGQGRQDLAQMLDPGWVADEIMSLRGNEYRYLAASILRNPARTEITETTP